jgi:hypothetical protein
VPPVTSTMYDEFSRCWKPTGAVPGARFSVTVRVRASAFWNSTSKTPLTWCMSVAVSSRKMEGATYARRVQDVLLEFTALESHGIAKCGLELYLVALSLAFTPFTTLGGLSSGRVSNHGISHSRISRDGSLGHDCIAASDGDKFGPSKPVRPRSESRGGEDSREGQADDSGSEELHACGSECR